MSIRIMSAIWETSFPPTDKLVFLALADCANDEGLAWPSIATIARKSGVSERTVQRSIRLGEKCGLLRREEVRGKGCRYFLTPRHSVTPDKVSPATNEAETPDKVSPNPSVSVNEEDKSSSVVELKPEHVVEAWNVMAERVGLPKVVKLTEERRRKLKARIKQNTIDEFTEAIAAVERSPFCRGEVNGFRADFDFLLQPKSFTKLIEGSYGR